MQHDPKKHRRRSIRLRNYNYAASGWYYITICTENKTCLFGHVANDKVILNDFGQIAENCWLAIPQHFNYIELDEYVSMPNHIHGIIHMKCPAHTSGSTPKACHNRTGTVPARRDAPVTVGPRKPQFGKPIASALSTIIRSYKSSVTKQINQLRNTPGAKFWHRNYYEHIIRNHDDLAEIRHYIRTNPTRWNQARTPTVCPPRRGTACLIRTGTACRAPTAESRRPPK